MERRPAEQRDRFSKYELLERLGQGGMGEVWKARDTQLQRYVALKLLRTDLQDDPDFIAYFMREARLVAALRHPNIVQIHDFQLAGTGRSAQAYMVMDYIEGGTLADAIRRMARARLFWSASEIVGLFTALSLALDYAHAQGMIHRDIKPANILLDQTFSTGSTLGMPVLTDFGIARWQSGDSTVKGFVGTPLYISPEQAQSRPLDVRSDLYSLGIILYEVLTGVTPFRGDNPLGIMLQHVDEPPPPPALINPLVSPALSAVVLRSIAKDPQARFASATALTIALAQAFAIPVPALLDNASERQQTPPANPLQPRSGITPLPPTFLPAQLSRNYTDPRPSFVSPVNEMTGPTSLANETTPVTSATHLLPAPSLSTGAIQAPGANAPQQPLGGTARGWLGTRRRKGLLAASLVGMLLVLLGSGVLIAGPRLFFATSVSTPVVPDGSVGRILFLSSSSVPQGTFNELQIDLTTVPSLPAGMVYYAWLTQANNESLTIPHWQLPSAKNGSIQDSYTSTPPSTNLFLSSDRFLITLEDSSMVPDVPTFVLTRHLYYALISHVSTASPSFVVRNCPTDNLNSTSNPCR